MEVATFRLRTRHLFAFVIPGSLWLATVFFASPKYDNFLDFIEGRGTLSDVAIRGFVFLTGGYLLGFAWTTFIWPHVMKRLKQVRPDRRTPSEKSFVALRKRAEDILKAQFPELNKQDLISDHWERLAKFFVEDQSVAMAHQLRDDEEEINLLCGLLVPAPVFLVTLTIHVWHNVWLTAAVLVVCVSLTAGLLAQLRAHTDNEYRDWLIAVIVASHASRHND